MGFFGNDIHNDPTLGGFERKGGTWQGVISLEGFGPVPLTVPGDRKRPDPASLALAPQAAVDVFAVRDALATALYEHWEPYFEAEVDEAPRLETRHEVWPHVRIERLVVDAAHAEFPVELRLTVPWDPEHTLGARIAHGELIELNGSV
ncbi:MAG: hypothetical protein K2R93_17265 [Gemmatimonadaceae bacterium]|nr:hypothetical protein [Gemmatimonadaceae bacterium]